MEAPFGIYPLACTVHQYLMAFSLTKMYGMLPLRPPPPPPSSRVLTSATAVPSADDGLWVWFDASNTICNQDADMMSHMGNFESFKC